MDRHVGRRTAHHGALAALVLAATAGGGSAQGARGGLEPGQDDSAPGIERVVSLLPAATKILIELGAADRLVARLETDRDPGFASLPSAGDVLSPNPEVIAALEPDLLIAWVGAPLGPLTDVLERSGTRVERLAIDRLADVAPAIRTIGGWVGQRTRADSVAATFERSIAETRALGRATSTAGGSRPSVLWVVSADPIVVAGPGNFLSDLIEVAGGVNAAGRTRSPWPRLGMESLVGLAPDVIVWPEGPGMFAAVELASRAGWQTLSAVEAGRVLAVAAQEYHDAGPHLAASARELTRRLGEMRETR